MKVNIFLACISTLLALLLAYWAFSITQGQENDIVCGVCSALCFSGTLVPTLAVSHESGRIGVNLQVLSAVFFVIFVISHFCFASFGVKMPYYVIVNGILLLAYIVILHGIIKEADA